MKKHAFVVVAALAALMMTMGLVGCSKDQATDRDDAGQGAPDPSVAPTTQPASGPSGAKTGDYDFSDPITHDNLTLFFIYGDDKIAGGEFLTLQEALEMKKIVVKETGNVQELRVKNVGDKPIYIQAGEIVRGGKQDRVFPTDLIVPPDGKEMPISSFCVEQGRWSARGAEASQIFSSSANAMNSNAGKIAAIVLRDQGAVWQSVASSQAELSEKVGKDVRSRKSASSLELTLSSEDLKKATEAYQAPLGKAIEGRKRVVGVAVVLNGKVHNVDIYGSSALFRKLYPKLLKANAVEAVAKKQKDLKFEIASAEDVKNWMAEAKKGQEATRRINDQMKMRIIQSDAAYKVSVEDGKNDSVHLLYLAN